MTSVAPVCVLACAAALAASPVVADPFLNNMPHSGIMGKGTLIEGSGLATYSIDVTNPNKIDPIVLDFALVTTIPVSGDPTDVISFPTVVSFPATIAAGKTATFTYTVQTGDSAFDGADFGVTDFSFSTEYSVIKNAPNTPTVYLGTNGGALIIGGQQSTMQDPATFATLVACLANPVACPNPPPNFLYPPSLNGGNPAYGAFTFKFVTVNDVPEPSAWALMLVGIGGLGWALRRRTSERTLRTIV
ncbi:MAG: PEP-CTERM sorting domain-containing protein [Caulobacteraceae bacterium]|nr:PEP-CTERM sorting domain-containing protein [Caulobacteraceae bacterium]